MPINPIQYSVRPTRTHKTSFEDKSPHESLLKYEMGQCQKPQCVTKLLCLCLEHHPLCWNHWSALAKTRKARVDERWDHSNGLPLREEHPVSSILNCEKLQQKLMYVFWVVMPWGFVGRYQLFGRTCCLHLHGWKNTNIDIFTAVRASDFTTCSYSERSPNNSASYWKTSRDFYDRLQYIIPISVGLLIHAPVPQLSLIKHVYCYLLL
jgi:hypothetical protein